MTWNKPMILVAVLAGIVQWIMFFTYDSPWIILAMGLNVVVGGIAVLSSGLIPQGGDV